MSVTLAQIESAIEAIVSAGPEVDYQIGDKRFNNSQKLKQLMELRKQYIENPEADIAMMDFDFTVNEFGKNTSENVS